MDFPFLVCCMTDTLFHILSLLILFSPPLLHCCSVECPKTPDQTTGGVTGASTSEACLCPKTDYFQNITENGDVECVDCPNGADCSARDGITLSELVALPGFWRPDPNSLVFSTCKEGFKGTDEVKNKLAEARCCPLNKKTNESTCMNLTFTKPEEQCQEGYTGALCLVCKDGWVPAGDDCMECEGGAQISLVFVSLFGLCVPIFLIVFILLVKSDQEEKIEKANGIFGQIKIMIAYIQIMSSMPGVMEGVPWPQIFTSFSVPFTAVNINFSEFSHTMYNSSSFLFGLTFFSSLSASLFLFSFFFFSQS